MPDTVIDYMQSNRPINRLCHSKQDRKNAVAPVKVGAASW